MMVVAEFCKACFYKMNPKEYYAPVMSKPWDRDLCEGCGKWKRVVVDLHPPLFFDLIGGYRGRDWDDDDE